MANSATSTPTKPPTVAITEAANHPTPNAPNAGPVTVPTPIAAPTPIQPPSLGRIVHYHLGAQVLAGIITFVFPNQEQKMVNLQIFYDNPRGAQWVTMVPFSPVPRPHTWCWPPRV